jgi:hypothetical protein
MRSALKDELKIHKTSESGNARTTAAGTGMPSEPR